jgi:small subunit ribosomal protein S5
MARKKRKGRYRRSNREDALSKWSPKTSLGKEVLAGQITNVDEIFASGQRILEPEIIDVLLPNMEDDVLEIESTQRMTPCGRKMQMKAVVVIGDRNGHVAYGTGKAPETRDAIGEAIRDAKKRVIRVPFGCGSWECGCGGRHSIPQSVSGKCSSTTVTIKPAPKGVGLVAGHTTRRVLELAGLKDAWTFIKGRTRNDLNTLVATIEALNQLNELKHGFDNNQQKEEKGEEEADSE